MCKFFSCIATRDGRLLFTEKDSHEEIVRRASLRDEHISYFVRLECLPPFVDVEGDGREIPAWFDLNDWSNRVISLANRVNRVFQPYKAVQRSAWEEYKAVQQSAWEQYKAVKRSAREEYKAVERPAWEEYKAVKRSAREEYDAVQRSAWEQALETLAKIEGYCTVNN